MKKEFLKLKRVLFFSILLFLIFPLIQENLNIIKIKPLKGAITPAKNKLFSFDGWIEGDYQEKKEMYLNESFGFRNIFVRINNQIAYTLFNKIKTKEGFVGKENYLFQKMYINAYYGTDFIGIDKITQQMQRLKFLQDTLSKLNKNIVLVFAPGKGSYYPEYIPDNFFTEKRKTNYEYYVQFARQLDINHIDFNKYFIDNKATSKYILYPQYGIHWSIYGASIAADSLIKYVEKIRSIDMPNIYWDTIEMDYAKNGDDDIGVGANLLFDLKGVKMAYPSLKIESDSGKVKPSLLVISDSFYWRLYKTEFQKLFSNNSEFWYYNKSIYPERGNPPLSTNDLNFKNEISKHEIIMILATDATLPEFGWGFIENLYNEFRGISSISHNDSTLIKKVNNTIKNIKANKKWYKQIEEKAGKRNIPVDSMLYIDALWQVKKNLKKKN